jgi:hypothetical protein
MTQKYTVTSDRLSRPRGSQFTTAELPARTIANLIAAGHLISSRESRHTPATPATTEEK